MSSGTEKKITFNFIKFLKADENENTIFINLWDGARVVLRWILIAENQAEMEECFRSVYIHVASRDWWELKARLSGERKTMGVKAARNKTALQESRKKKSGQLMALYG